MPTTKATTKPTTAPNVVTAIEGNAKPKLPSHVTKVGNLTKDWELAYSPNGAAHAHSAIAVNGWGERKDQVDFYNLIAFNTLAENLAACTQKGTRLIVAGRPQIREWDREDGSKGSVKEILINDAGIELRFKLAIVQDVDRNQTVLPLADDDPEMPF